LVEASTPRNHQSSWMACCSTDIDGCATLGGINYGGLGDIDSKLLLWIVVGTLLVGFCEELMYRGLVLVGFRGGMREALAWFWSSVAFGLLHSIKFFLGQDLLPTLQQAVMTFLIGSGFYIARRTTGVIFVPMAGTRCGTFHHLPATAMHSPEHWA
jgi:membrane protease YdiL (CAAX protease family)